jgi:hypothetical protein
MTYTVVVESCPFLELSHDGINVWEAGPPLLPRCQLFRIADEKNVIFLLNLLKGVIMSNMPLFFDNFLLTLDPDPFFREFKPKFRSKFLMNKQF